jgi:hypothetical protein
MYAAGLDGIETPSKMTVKGEGINKFFLLFSFIGLFSIGVGIHYRNWLFFPIYRIVNSLSSEPIL